MSESENPWIPVDEMLPEPGQLVFVHARSHPVVTQWEQCNMVFDVAACSQAFMDVRGRWHAKVNGERITHWIPMPPPPPGQSYADRPYRKVVAGLVAPDLAPNPMEAAHA